MSIEGSADKRQALLDEAVREIERELRRPLANTERPAIEHVLEEMARAWPYPFERSW